MEDAALKIFLLMATAMTGILCGASLDQSIKQLPARRIIEVKIFSEYAKAADLRNGVIWYAILGLGSALLSIITAIWTAIYHAHSAYALPLFLAGFFAVCHSICTGMAAPTYHKQKKIESAAALEKLFNKFEAIQTIRSIFIVLNFLSFIFCLLIII